MVKIWQDSPGTYIEARMKEYLPKRLLYVHWLGGKSAKGIFPDDLIMECRGKPLDYFSNAAMRVVSGKVKEILEHEHAKVEFFRVLVDYRKKLLGDFFIVNFLEVVDCLDEEKTVYSEEGLISHSIKRLALKLEVLGDKPLFVIQGTSLLGASDRLASEVEKAKCTGVWFPSPEEWRNPAIPGDIPGKVSGSF